MRTLGRSRPRRQWVLALLLAGALVLLEMGRQGWPWAPPARSAVQSPPAGGDALFALAAPLDVMGEFRIRTAVNAVPGPEGTGLPNVRRVGISSSGPFTVSVHLEVVGVDNPAWLSIADADRLRYADEVLDAVAAAASPLAWQAQPTSAWVAVKVWDWFVVPKDSHDFEPDDAACRRMERAWDRWECYGVAVSLSMELPLIAG